MTHEPGCAAERVERYSAEQPTGLHARIVRCLDCGAQDTTAMANVPPLPTPHDPANTTGPWRFA